MKKSLLITLHFPPEHGGEQAYYYNVCKNLPADKIVVLAPEVPGSEYFDANQPFTIIRTSTLNGLPKNMPRFIAKLLSTRRWLAARKVIAEVIRRHNIEMVQAGQILPIGTLAMMIKKSHGLPYIFYAHGLDVVIGQKKKRKKELMKKIIAGAKDIVVNSHFTKDILKTLGADDKKMHVIHPCPNLSAVEVPEKDIDWINSEYKLHHKPVILTVGRLVKRKGHDVVIDALTRIAKRIPEIQYIIVGDGPEKTNLQKKAATLGVASQVHFIGSVARYQLPAYFERADIFIMPARQLEDGDAEGFGIVYLEANMYGTPVIAGKSGGVNEAVIHEKTGLLVDPTNIDEVANAVIGLLTNKAYAQQLGMQGLARVDEEFQWPEQVSQIKQLLR